MGVKECRQPTNPIYLVFNTKAPSKKMTEPTYKHTIRGAPAFSELEVTLEPGQAILADGGTVTFLREGVERGVLTTGAGGFFAALGRDAGGDTFFMNTYTGLLTGERKITLAAPYPGDMVYMDMAAGSELVVARGTFLASSPNVKITGKLNLRGIFSVGQNEGAVLLKLVCGPEGPGCVWLTGYGCIREHVLAADQTLLVNNGRFLATKQHDPSDTLYTVVQMGKSAISSLLGSEGLGMLFTGPRTLWTQSHDLGGRSGGDAVGGGDNGGVPDVLGNAVDLMGMGNTNGQAMTGGSSRGRRSSAGSAAKQRKPKSAPKKASPSPKSKSKKKVTSPKKKEKKLASPKQLKPKTTRKRVQTKAKK